MMRAAGAQLNSSSAARAAAHEREHVVTVVPQLAHEFGADESGCPATRTRSARARPRSGQARFEGDRDAGERLRDRAVLLGLLGEALEVALG